MIDLKLIAPAKLNLYLHITGRRNDGYHLLESLFAFTQFGDVITITPAKTLSLTMDGPFSSAITSTIDHNLIYQTALHLQKKYNVAVGAAIHLTKNIPVSAGLGGGSSDAACILKGLNQLWDLKLSQTTLSAIGLQLGADIPACITAKPAIVSGIGECITPITLPITLPVLLVNSNNPLSTKTVFQHYQKSNQPFHIPSEDFTLFNDWHSFKNVLTQNCNDLALAAMELQPEIQVILDTLKQQPGCELARMSGSGPTCFACFNNTISAQKANVLLQHIFPNYWIMLTSIPNGNEDASFFSAQIASS